MQRRISVESLEKGETDIIHDYMLSIMTGHGSKGMLALRRHLQKFYKQILPAIASIGSKEAECSKQITSLGNLLEQIASVQRVQVEEVNLLVTFPDLKKKLMVKLSSEVEQKVDILKTLMLPLQELWEAAYRAQSEVSVLIQKYPKDLSLLALAEETELVPTLRLLDWLHEAESQAQQLYECRLHLLDQLSQLDGVDVDSFASKWHDGASQMLSAHKDLKEMIDFFLEEKV